MFQIGFKHVAWENAHGDPGDRDATTEKCANAKFPTLGLYVPRLQWFPTIISHQ